MKTRVFAAWIVLLCLLGTTTSLAQPLKGKRIVIASTGANSEAVFLPPPDMTSFMYHFLGSAYMGNSMGEAWRSGQRFFDEFAVSNQTPQLHDGTTTTTPGVTSTQNADREFFGATWAYGVQSTMDVNLFFPAFDAWTTSALVSPGFPVTLWTRMLPGQDPVEVTAVVRPPAPDVLSGDPVTDLPHVSLQRKSNTPGHPDYRVWETVDTQTFSQHGIYTVSFTARFDYERLSNPVFGRITVSEGLDPDTTPIRAVLAIGQTASLGLETAFADLGPYAYSIYLDRFQDDSGVHHPEWIEYLIDPFLDADSDAWPTSANALAAIAAMPGSLPDGRGRLFVHLIGESATPGEVELSPGDALTAAALDGALDTLQARPGQEWTAILVVDAPGAGAFAQACAATSGQNRVIMTSGRAEDGAFFLPSPTLTCFSQKVLGAAYQGLDLRSSFNAGNNFFSRFLRYFLINRIYPQLEDTGDGIYTPGVDGPLAATLYLGRRYAFAGDDAAGLPFILDLTTSQTVQVGETAVFTATLIEGVTPQRVFAQFVQETGSTQTITSLPEVDFARTAPDIWSWSAEITAPLTSGTYPLAVYASYADGAESKLSDPAFTALQVVPVPPDLYDLPPYNDDESATCQNYLPVNASQYHVIHAPGNLDWLLCPSYTANMLTPFSLHFTALDIPAGSNLLVKLYEDGPEAPPTDQMRVPAEGDYFTWQALGDVTTSTVYISVEGEGDIYPRFEYHVELNRNTGANNGLATAIGTNQMSLSWDSFTLPGNYQGFNVARSQTGANLAFAALNGSPIPAGAGVKTAYLDLGLSPATLYFYRVNAVDSVGAEEAWTPIFYGVTDPELPQVALAASSDETWEKPGTVDLYLVLSESVGTAVIVQYECSGSALPGIDYETPLGTVTFYPGETVRSIPIRLLDDYDQEPRETLVLTLTNATNATLGAPVSMVLTIWDNDRPYEPTQTIDWTLYE
ncbi:hypothetical protein HQ520_19110 [bacterium]|nr:hypothetical protein [bacterium]